MAVRQKSEALEALDPNKFYSAKYLAERWGIHHLTILKWVSRGHLPRPVRLGENTSRWPGSVIESFERQRRDEGRD
jgi:predicted DNA-binding transcriptional regulator AlpA